VSVDRPYIGFSRSIEWPLYLPVSDIVLRFCLTITFNILALDILITANHGTWEMKAGKSNSDTSCQFEVTIIVKESAGTCGQCRRRWYLSGQSDL
jgi:hypothetical protein